MWLQHWHCGHMYFHQGSLGNAIYCRKGVWQGPQDLIGVIKLVEKLNTAQQVTATLSPPTMNMRSSDNWCFVLWQERPQRLLLLWCTVLQLQQFWSLHPGLPREKCPQQEHITTVIDYAPTIVATAEIVHTLSITDAGKGTTLTCQDHTINLNMTEAPVTTADMHPTLYHVTATACNTHPQKDTLEGSPTGKPTPSQM